MSTQRGRIFKAATWAASKLDRMTASEFADEFAGKLHDRDGNELNRETLIAGYKYAQKEAEAGRLTRFEVN